MAVDDPLDMVWLDTNDLGNAERFVRLSKGLILWTEELGWVGYDTRRWSTRDGHRMAARLAHDVARHVDTEAIALAKIADDAEALKEVYGEWCTPDIAGERVLALRKHAIRSGNASQTEAMLRQAKSLIAAYPEDFDTDKLALNLANGTLRFFQDEGGGWAVRCDPHDPVDRMMQIAEFEYDETALCPKWRERLMLVQPDRDQRALIQQVYGYMLTGLTSEQKWFIFQGRGGDGKSLTNAVIAELMGDYYRHAEVKSFLEGAQKSGSDHSSDMARLQGDIRFVSCDEPGQNTKWNGGRLKQVTGGKVTARGLREKEIEYYPRWKLIVEVNPLPAVPSDDDGFWRRCVVAPWKYQFDKGGQAAQPWDILVGELKAEGAGILNWMIAGALKWLGTRRLPASAASIEAVDNYRQSASPMGEWLVDRCDTSDPSAETPAGLLYADFKAWCERAGIEKVPSNTAFGRALRDRQHMVRKDPKGNRWRKGIKLRPDDSAPELGRDPGVSNGGGGGRAEPGSIWEEDDDLP